MQQETGTAGPLEGIRVVDLTRYQAGPACTVMLADMGADVVKVESPGQGDQGRTAFATDSEGVGAYFIAMNHGKRAIAVDLYRPPGRDLLLRLIAGCDVLVENFRPGTAAALGLGYEDCARVNERLVYASVSAFGERGPMRDMAGFDIHAQAVGGIMSTTGNDDGAYPAGAAIGDQTAGMTLCTAILAALFARERRGLGQKVAVSLYGCQMALQSWEISHYAMTRQLPGKGGTSHPTVKATGVVWGGYATRDGQIALGVLGPKQQRKFLAAIGIEEAGAVGDEFMTDLGHLDAEIRQRLRERTTQTWLETLTAADIHIGPINNYEDILADDQAWANDYLVRVPHANGRTYDVVGSPITFSKTPARIRSAAPELGEHTEQVLREAGLEPGEIAHLREQGII